MKYDIREKESIVVISPEGKMIAGSALKKLNSKIEEYIRSGTRRIVIDLGAVELIDSHGLGSILTILKSLKDARGDFKLARITTKIESVFTIPGGPVIRNYDSVDEAVKSFQDNS